MAKKRQRLQMWAKHLGDGPPPHKPQQQVAPFTRLVTLYVPKRLASHRQENARAVVDEVNDKIATRGYIEADGQILLTPLDPFAVIDMTDVWGCNSDEQRSRIS